MVSQIIFRFVFMVAVGIFLMIIWKVPITEISFWRWIIGWSVGIVLFTEMDNIQQYFLG